MSLAPAPRQFHTRILFMINRIRDLLGKRGVLPLRLVAPQQHPVALVSCSPRGLSALSDLYHIFYEGPKSTSIVPLLVLDILGSHMSSINYGDWSIFLLWPTVGMSFLPWARFSPTTLVLFLRFLAYWSLRSLSGTGLPNWVEGLGYVGRGLGLVLWASDCFVALSGR